VTILFNDGSALLWNDGSRILWNPPLATVVINRCQGGGHVTFAATGPGIGETFDVAYDDLFEPSLPAERYESLTLPRAKLLDDARIAVADASASTWPNAKAAVEGRSYAVLEAAPQP
jgi:hypothetical protein